MQGYMQDAKFSRGKKEILAFASIVLLGNIDVQAKLPHEKYYHLFEPLPDFLQVEAFIDRFHGYLPGWEIPKIHPGSLAQDYGFITDYFRELMHELRRKDLPGSLKGRYQLMDSSTAKAGITGRDVRGVDPAGRFRRFILARWRRIMDSSLTTSANSCTSFGVRTYLDR
jgi:ATP-dependent Lon protease